MGDLDCETCGTGLEWGVDTEGPVEVEMTYCPECDDETRYADPGDYE